MGQPLTLHGCWCPLLSQETAMLAKKGHPSGGSNSFDGACQRHSQCKNCIHNSVPQTEMAKYFQFYTVKFEVDRIDPNNMLKTKILCNPKEKSTSNWIDEDYNEEKCHCDVAFLKEFIDFYLREIRPDPEFNGVCQNQVIADRNHDIFDEAIFDRRKELPEEEFLMARAEVESPKLSDSPSWS